MSLNTFFSVENEDLSRLQPQDAVEFFRNLLLAEATRIGLSKTKIDVPSAITVSDGGIDASVKNDHARRKRYAEAAHCRSRR